MGATSSEFKYEGFPQPTDIVIPTGGSAIITFSPTPSIPTNNLGIVTFQTINISTEAVPPDLIRLTFTGTLPAGQSRLLLNNTVTIGPGIPPSRSDTRMVQKTGNYDVETEGSFAGMFLSFVNYSSKYGERYTFKVLVGSLSSSVRVQMPFRQPFPEPSARLLTDLVLQGTAFEGRAIPAPPSTLIMGNNNEVPLIFINVDSAFSAQDFGAATFAIYDNYQYNNEQCCQESHSSIKEKIYLSKFYKYPKINKVLLGDGCLLVDQFLFIINKFGLTIDIDTFTGQMALYSMLRYVLSYLLYGNFSVNYLRRRYAQQFLIDLEASRFSEFLVVFVDPQYGLTEFGKYFKK